MISFKFFHFTFLSISIGSDSSCTDDGYTEVRFDGDYLKVRKFTIDKYETYPFDDAQDKCRKEKAELWEVRFVAELSLLPLLIARFFFHLFAIDRFVA